MVTCKNVSHARCVRAKMYHMQDVSRAKMYHVQKCIAYKMYYTVKNIWRSYIWTADKEMNESDLRSDVHYLGNSENKPVKWWIDG